MTKSTIAGNVMSDSSADPALLAVEKCKALRVEYDVQLKSSPENAGEADRWEKTAQAYQTLFENALSDMLDTQATTHEGCVALIDEFFQCNGEQMDDQTRELLRNLRTYLKSAK